MTLLIPFLLSALWASPAPRGYYLSASGNDGSDGLSPATAWKSLSRLNETRFRPGDQILLEGGAVFEGQLRLSGEDEGTPELPVVIDSYGTGRATLLSRDTSGIIIQDAGGIVLKNLIVKGADRTKNRGHGVEIVNTRPGADKRRFIRLENISASSFGMDGIFLGGNPADGSQSGFEDVQITRCEVFDNQYHGIFITGVWDTNAKGYANRNLRIDHCKAYDNTGDPLYWENHSGSGMEIDNVEDAVVEYCEAYNNGFLCNSRVGGPCGIWLHSANRAVIQHCVAINNRTGSGLDGAGFDLDGGTTNCIIQHCYARDNDGAGILVWNYAYAPHTLENNIIRFNILENNGRRNDYASIHVGSNGTPVRNMRIYNNTVLTSYQPQGQAHGARVAYGPSEDIFWQNNLFISNGCPQVIIDPGQKNVRFEGNFYASTAGPSEFRENGQSYSDLSHWQRMTQQELLPGGRSAGKSGDPLCSSWLSAESPKPGAFGSLRAYHPLKNSPLSGGGVTLKDMPPGQTDFAGNPVNQGLIGALAK